MIQQSTPPPPDETTVDPDLVEVLVRAIADDRITRWGYRDTLTAYEIEGYVREFITSPNVRGDVHAVLAALAEHGALMPTGGETHTTWRVQWFCEDRPEGRIDFDDEAEARAYFADDEVTSRVVEGVWRAELQRQTVTTWPEDHPLAGTHYGPWRQIDG